MERKVVIVGTDKYYRYLTTQLIPWMSRVLVMPLNRDLVARKIVSATFYEWAVYHGYHTEQLSLFNKLVKNEYRSLHHLALPERLLEIIDSFAPITKDKEISESMVLFIKWLMDGLTLDLIDNGIGSLQRMTITDYKWVGSDLGVCIEYP